jgi:predicted transcriptional regulator
LPHRDKFQVIAGVLEYCNMVARKSTRIQLKCKLGNQYFELLAELVTLNLISRRQIGARSEYITTPLGREWLHHYYALMRLQGKGEGDSK